MEKQSVLNIPILRDIIATYLSKHDLARCSEVSQEWSIWFKPYIWHTINLDSKGCRGHDVNSDLANLVPVRNYIRVLRNCRIEDVVDLKNTWPIPYLQILEITNGKKDQHCRRYLKMISRVAELTFLRSLIIILGLDNTDVCQKLICTLKSLPMLKKFGLTNRGYFDPVFVYEIIQTCSEFEYLSLKLSMKSYDKEEEKQSCEIARQVIELIPNTEIRRLFFHTNSEDIALSILIPLLRCCPKLEGFMTQAISSSKVLEWLAKAFKENVCPQLQRWSQERDDHRSIEKIEAYTKIFRSIGSAGYRFEADGSQRKSGLEAITMDIGYLDSPHISQAIAEYHGDMLTVLNFSHGSAYLHGLAKLLYVLPKLKTLVAGIRYPKISNGYLACVDPNLTFDNLFWERLEEPWVCTRLKNLELNLEPFVSGQYKSVDNREWLGSPEKRCMDILFIQISRMKKLKEWRMVTPSIDLLVLKKGYLGLLGDLKGLKGLHISRGSSYRMEVKEAEWIGENWTGLQEFKISLDGYMNSRVKAVRDAFVAALKENRPMMEIDHGQGK
ncbi:hypothetical protein BGX26_002413 [Mortierella sp. AD094]|nr:hypothetical protein BGX26_002413 [Mortierella sp. AD094]